VAEIINDKIWLAAASVVDEDREGRLHSVA
jgi:hypothetical protein